MAYPYNRENIERVRRDEAEAREKERAEDARLAEVESASRIQHLRERRDTGLPSQGHINFWEEYESGKKQAETPIKDTEPIERKPRFGNASMELQPWYAAPDLRNGREKGRSEEEKEQVLAREAAHKLSHDPLQTMCAALDQRASDTKKRAWGTQPYKTETLLNERLSREAKELRRTCFFEERPVLRAQHESSDNTKTELRSADSDDLWDSFAALPDGIHGTPPLELPAPQQFGKESMYVELFQEIICTVLERENFLFTVKEQECLSSILLLPYASRYLLVRLLQRKRDWYRLDRLAYAKEVDDVQEAAKGLCQSFGMPCSPNGADDHLLCSYAQMDTEMEGGLEERIALLTLPELKEIAKRLGVARAKTRVQLVAQLLARPTNATLFSLSGPCSGRELRMTETPSHARLEKALERSMAGGCIRILPAVSALVERMTIVYYRGLPAFNSMLTSAVLSRTKKCHFPEYTIQRTPDLFENRDQVVQYAYALHLEKEMDACVDALSHSTAAVEQGIACLAAGWELWKEAVADVRKKYPDGVSSAIYPRMRFHPGWVLTRIVYKGCHCVARQGHAARERGMLRGLLAQRYFRRGQRGAWHERLAIVAAKTQRGMAKDQVLQCKREALACCQAALADPDTHLVYVFSLQQRIQRLEAQLKIPLAERHDFAHLQLRAADHVHLCGRRVGCENEAGKRSTWQGKNGQPVTVEEFCLERYAAQGFRGFHCEGRILHFLFALLMWDILFAPVPGAFETQYQREPLDLATDVFAIARRDALSSRLAHIEKTGGLDLIGAVDARERRLRTYAVACRWDCYTSEELLEIAECIGGRALALLCRLLSEEWAMRTSGFPDLCIWRYKDKQVHFAEVKSPKDRLSGNQKVWIDVLLRAGLVVRVVHVDDVH
ncbi:hypothetical protein MVES_000878 [Malassezia vespertilionis]|uniref:Fanconi-associated nuclease n=1 Tax=Malassezia vespertilionis TaxID=2020962 RepID=A0A2N1JE42_9BASI|nr:hypothetical protein MVES_000878 [Malassezia vespertilionis]